MRPLLFFILLLGSGFWALSSRAEGPPNIIVIYTDDHGWPDIGPAGIYEDLKTPHLDALAVSGVRATSGYSTAPQCVPSRAGLLAGRFQNRFGVESNGVPLEGFDAQETIAERLKKAGYATGQIGKWHLGPTDAITDHGFDDVYSKNANRPCHANYTLDGKTREMGMVDDKLYHLDACSEAALAFIRRHEKQPFFLYLAYRAPHVPLDAPPKYLSRFPGKMPERRRQALAMISAMDDGVGAIVQELKARKLTEKTLIFYIGDNGAPLKIHMLDAPGGGPGWDGSLNKPMNGEKGMLTEGGMRVPFLVAWPGTIPGGQVYHEPVISLDVAATAVALAGLPEDKALDGVNLVPYLSGKKSGAPHEILTWRWISQAAIRDGKWKLLRRLESEYLFDLEADPGELKNLRDAHPEIANRLRSRLTQWAGELQPPGLVSKEGSLAAKRYYDFYLDGKPAPPVPDKSLPAEGESKALQGWVMRGATAVVEQGALHVTPEKGKRRPFLAQAGLKLNGPLTAKIRLQSRTGGKLGFAWRLEGQKDFVEGQAAAMSVLGDPGWQDLSLDLPAEGEIIHLRVHLPEGDSAIVHVTLMRQKKALKTWDFSKE